ncbi:MAG: Lrp/AsnC family transcriptional regulator, partial [Thermoplasmata archaeon]
AMDEKDAKIIEILRANARKKNTEIARAIGLTEGAVRARISALKKSGIIKRFTIEAESVGVEGIVLVATDAGKTKEVVSKLKEMSEAVYETSGEYDAAVLIRSANVDDLNSNVDKIRELPGVVKTSTLIRMA